MTKLITEMKYVCTGCGVEKDYNQMRKRNGHGNITQCNACELKVRNRHKDRIAQQKLNEAAAVQKAKEDAAYKMKNSVKNKMTGVYVPEKVWTRNNGNVHILSRGYSC